MQVAALIVLIIAIEAVIRFSDYRKKKHEKVIQRIRDYR